MKSKFPFHGEKSGQRKEHFLNVLCVFFLNHNVTLTSGSGSEPVFRIRIRIWIQQLKGIWIHPDPDRAMDPHPVIRIRIRSPAYMSF
jgi:hypothetical protein